MGYKTYTCEQCHKTFYQPTAIYHGDDKDPPAGMMRGWSTRFCSRACKKEWEKAHPGQSADSCSEKVLKLPFVLTWWVFVKGCKCIWWCCKNKWVWTIFSCGFSYLSYRILKAIYEKDE